MCLLCSGPLADPFIVSELPAEVGPTYADYLKKMTYNQSEPYHYLTKFQV